MYVAYSAIDPITTTDQLDIHYTQPGHVNHELVLRYEAYRATCDKFSHEIAAIQKYFPGWAPKFSY